MHDTISLESLKSFCYESSRTALHRQVLDKSGGNIVTSSMCRNPVFISDKQLKILSYLQDLYHLFNQSKVKPKDLVYAGIAKDRKVAWEYPKRLRELCVLDEDNNINIERVEELLKLPVRMISRGIERGKSLRRKGSRRYR
jgi:hypothetical protein